MTFHQSGCTSTIRDPDFRKLIVSVGAKLVFFIDPQKTKVDQNCYTDLLKTSLQYECRRLYPGNDFECLQDSVLSHHAKVTSARGYKVIGQILNICINYAN